MELKDYLNQLFTARPVWGLAELRGKTCAKYNWKKSVFNEKINLLNQQGEVRVKRGWVFPP